MGLRAVILGTAILLAAACSGGSASVSGDTLGSTTVVAPEASLDEVTGGEGAGADDAGDDADVGSNAADDKSSGQGEDAGEGADDARDAAEDADVGSNDADEGVGSDGEGADADGATSGRDEGANGATSGEGEGEGGVVGTSGQGADAGSSGGLGRDLVGLQAAIEAYPFTLWPSNRGDSGQAVVDLQDRLTEVGIGSGGSDGSYGPRTAAAVEAFQRLVDLEPTGDATAETVAALSQYRYEGLLLRRGDEGEAVKALQQRLGDGPFDPGPADGNYGPATVQAVWALEKLAGMPTDGDWGPLDEKAWQLLTAGQIGGAERNHDTRWVEVDLSRQLVKVYDPQSATPRLITHASSGSGIPWENEEHSGSSITPTGDFQINRRIAGWRESSLDIGRLYNPLYFNGGIAFHGATSVPLYPASHGCVRLPMHIADYLPDELPNGTAVHVLS